MRFVLVHIFYALLLGTLVFALNFENNETSFESKNSDAKKNQESIFYQSHISVLKSGPKNMYLYSDKLIDRAVDNKVFFVSPKGEFGTKIISRFSGRKGVLDKIKSTLDIDGQAKLERDNMISLSDSLKVSFQTNFAKAVGNVHSLMDEDSRKVKINSQVLEVSDKVKSLKYAGVVTGNIRARKKGSFSNIDFKSDLLTYDYIDKIIFLEGNAKITRAKSKISGLRGNIWLNNQSSGVKYFSMNDDVRIIDEFVGNSGNLVLRRSFSEMVEGFSNEKKLILSGFPQVQQGGDIIKGNEMIVREDEEVIEIINTNSQFKLKNRNSNE